MYRKLLQFFCFPNYSQLLWQYFFIIEKNKNYMDRFEYLPAILAEDESFVYKHLNIRLFDGDVKTIFENGEVLLTSHRLFWGYADEIDKGMPILCLQLKYVVSLQEETVSFNVFGKKKRMILHLNELDKDTKPISMYKSKQPFIKISGKHGLDAEFIKGLSTTIEAKVWAVSGEVLKIKLRTGIIGIERNLLEKRIATDNSISVAFQDLKKLMAMAKEMVNISKIISIKLSEQKTNSDLSEDETIKFKKYLMSLGIDDPVTRENYQTNNEYYVNLSIEINKLLINVIDDMGGMMPLTDVYCRINRARGLELISPDDLLNACKLLNGHIKLRVFPSGTMILQSSTHNEDNIIKQTLDLIEEHKSLSVEEHARLIGISLILAQERLLITENAGHICRDESIEGLRFYPNLFLV